MILKQIHTITVKDVILLDTTKSANHLKKFRFIPIWFLRKQLESLAKQIFSLIGDSHIDTVQEDFDKLISYRNLQILEALYKLVTIELRLRAKIDIWKLISGKELKEAEQLAEVLAEVLKYTGIDIKEPKDVTDFNDYLEFRIAKHKELFPDKKIDENVNNKPISEIIYSYFNFMAEPHNREMLLIDFVAMKKIADERILNSQKDKENG